MNEKEIFFEKARRLAVEIAEKAMPHFGDNFNHDYSDKINLAARVEAISMIAASIFSYCEKYHSVDRFGLLKSISSKMDEIEEGKNRILH